MRKDGGKFQVGEGREEKQPGKGHENFSRTGGTVESSEKAKGKEVEEKEENTKNKKVKYRSWW